MTKASGSYTRWEVCRPAAPICLPAITNHSSLCWEQADRIGALYVSLKHPRTRNPLLAEKHTRPFAWLLTLVSRERSVGYCWTIGGPEKKSIIPASWQTLYRLHCLRFESVGFRRHTRRRKRRSADPDRDTRKLGQFTYSLPFICSPGQSTWILRKTWM